MHGFVRQIYLSSNIIETCKCTVSDAFKNVPFGVTQFVSGLTGSTFYVTFKKFRLVALKFQTATWCETHASAYDFQIFGQPSGRSQSEDPYWTTKLPKRVARENDTHAQQYRQFGKINGILKCYQYKETVTFLVLLNCPV